MVTHFHHQSQYANANIKVPLAEVPYVDRPSIQVSAAESVEMPFKYVKGKDGKAIMPEVSSTIQSDEYQYLY